MSEKRAPFRDLLAVSAFSHGVPNVAYLYQNDEFSHETGIKMTPKGHAIWPEKVLEAIEIDCEGCQGPERAHV
jgi:hypothetical protein